MSEHPEGKRPAGASARAVLRRAICVLLLAATAAACDRCGDIVSPIRFLADQQPDACRDQAPKLR